MVLAERAFCLASPGPFLCHICTFTSPLSLAVVGVWVLSEEHRIWSCLGDGFRLVSVFWACSVRRRYMLLRGNLVISYEPPYLAMLFVVVVSPEMQNFGFTGR